MIVLNVRPTIFFCFKVFVWDVLPYWYGYDLTTIIGDKQRNFLTRSIVVQFGVRINNWELNGYVLNCYIITKKKKEVYKIIIQI